MNSINPKYIIALLAVVLIAIVIKLMNPYQELNTEAYWKSATLSSIRDIPDEALVPGNKVLMWASSFVSDPDILTELVNRGSDINEVDPNFLGTPLSAAAVDNNNPDIIRELIRLGANIEARVSLGNTPLMGAAIYNHNPAILEALVANGANVEERNYLGQTALQLARLSNNQSAVSFFMTLNEKNQL